jgi:hypothetical protein
MANVPANSSTVAVMERSDMAEEKIPHSFQIQFVWEIVQRGGQDAHGSLKARAGPPYEEAADHSRGPLGTKVPAYLSSTTPPHSRRFAFIRGSTSFFEASARRRNAEWGKVQKFLFFNLSVIFSLARMGNVNYLSRVARQGGPTEMPFRLLGFSCWDDRSGRFFFTGLG